MAEKRAVKPPRQDVWPPDDIHIEGGRLQKLKEPIVARLMDSIAVIGLQAPVDVRLEPDGEGNKRAVLIAGRHRVEACKRLGFVLMPVRIFDDTTHAHRWEVDENLARGVLTKAERDAHLRALAERVEEGISVQNGPKNGRGRPKGGEREVARQLGVPRTTLRRARANGGANKTDGMASKDAPTAPKPAHRPEPRQETEQAWLSALLAVFARGEPEWQERARDALYPVVAAKPILRVVS